MDFELTDEQRTYRDAVADFARRELSAPARVPEDFDRDAWRRCAAMGIQGLAVPGEYGGSGADATTIAVAMEALGYACADNGLIFSLNAQMWACQYPIARSGSDEQKQRYLPGLCDGSLVAAHATSEPDSGSDAFALRTTAVRRGDRFVLNGSKTFVTNAPVADVFLVFATVDPARRFGGIAGFLVDRTTPGLTVSAPVRKMGLDGSPVADVRFDDCEVPAGAMLGAEGAGMPIFRAAMERERGLILASAVGTMQRNLDACVRHARERHQFGGPIGRFQAVAHRIVEMKVRLETSRLLLYRLAWLIDRGCPTDAESALVKLHLSECFVQSSLDAVQVHGGYGYLSEYGVERDLRDAVASRLYSGTSEIQRNLVARSLGL